MSRSPTLLRLLVARRHVLRYESFLPQFEEAARVLAAREQEPRLASATIGKRQYERWLSGKLAGKPHPDSCRVLEHMFPYTVDELFSPADESDLSAARSTAAPPAETPFAPGAQPGIQTTAFADPSTGWATQAGHHGGGDDMRRRTVLRGLITGVGAGLTATTLEVIEGIRREMDATLTDRGGLDVLEEWERRAEDYVQAYMVIPPASVLKDALLDFTDVQSALMHGQYGQHRARLWRLSAQLSGMIGVCLYVLGQHRDARAWYQTGRRAAEICDDEALQAWMYVRLAGVSLHFGVPTSALGLVNTAATLHRGPSGTAARTHLFRARTLARMGDRLNARNALNEARASFDQLDGPDILNKAFGYTERQFLAHSANALTIMRDTKAAQRAREEAYAAYAAHGMTEYQDPALARIDEALCLLWSSDPIAACRHVMETIGALPDGHRTGLVRLYALEFQNALTPAQQRLRAGVELREFLASTFNRAPTL